MEVLASHEGLWSPHGWDWLWLVLFVGWFTVFGGALLVAFLMGVFGEDRD